MRPPAASVALLLIPGKRGLWELWKVDPGQKWKWKWKVDSDIRSPPPLESVTKHLIYDPPPLGL